MLLTTICVLPALDGVLLDTALLSRSRELVAVEDPSVMPAYRALIVRADVALELVPPAVTQKRHPAPSGDPHDYVSLLSYAWPNPNSADGMPWHQEDGRKNPLTNEYDRPRLSAMYKAVVDLGFAWYFSGDERYGAKAAELLRVFFLDEATRMNPHLRYAQFFPGNSDGTRWGLIETGDLAAEYFMDAVALLCEGGQLSESERQGLRDWFAAYLDWLQTSPRGLELKMEQHNNIRTAYELQCAVFARFCGDHKRAAAMLVAFPAICIDRQIREDGLQPEELWRTKSMGYSAKNLRLLLQMGQLARHYDIDIDGYRSPQGVGIRDAVDAMLPYWRGEQRWEHKQIRVFRRERAHHVLRWSAHAYDEPAYETAIGELRMGEPQEPWAEDLQRLLWPLPIN